jgi:hypothetical protein
MDDGNCDVTIISNQTNGGRCALVRYLLGSETGDYFDGRGQLNANLGMHYLKTSSWELDPSVKAFPPDEMQAQEGFELNPDYVYDNNALFSIDGERYKS